MKKNLKELVRKTILGTVAGLLANNTQAKIIDNKFEEDLSNHLSEENEGEVYNPLKYEWQPKLLLSLNEDGDFEYNSHRSHRSHQSHRSHYSSNSGHASHFSHYSSYTPNSNSSNRNSSRSNSTPSYIKPQTQNYDKVIFENYSGETIWVLVRYYSTRSEWETKAWYKILPGENAYLFNTKNSIFYYYAESATKKWQGDDGSIYKDGKKYMLRKVKINTTSWGTYKKTIW